MRNIASGTASPTLLIVTMISLAGRRYAAANRRLELSSLQEHPLQAA